MKNKTYKVFIVFAVIVAALTAGFLFFRGHCPVKPNIIIIHIDALRPDHLGCYGYMRNTSPNIDVFAKEGVLFSNAITQATITLGSNPSFITSTYPYRHFIDYANQAAYVNPRDISLFEVLKEHGYVTALLTDQPYLGRIKGFEKHLDSFLEIKPNSPQLLTPAAIKWLKEHKDKKFMLWLYYYGVHSPYRVTSAATDMFLKDGLGKLHKKVPIADDDANEKFGVIPWHAAEFGITDADYYVAKYDAKIHLLDSEIARVLEGLRALGLEKDTLVILTADHGESLGEHGLYFNHGNTLYDELLRVPLIMRYPSRIPRNKVVSNQARLLDVIPTILDILGIEPAASMKGSSLWPCVLRRTCRVAPYAFSDIEAVSSVRTPEWKLIYADRGRIITDPYKNRSIGGHYLVEYALYNLKGDPKENYNLVDEEKKVFEGLKKILDDHVAEGRQSGSEVRQEIDSDSWHLKRLPLREGPTKEKLRSLGYLQ